MDSCSTCGIFSVVSADLDTVYIPSLAGMQVFPADMPGQYINKVDFGLVKADLLANYTKTAQDNINVDFVYIRFMLGPLSFKQVESSCMFVFVRHGRQPYREGNAACCPCWGSASAEPMLKCAAAYTGHIVTGGILENVIHRRKLPRVVHKSGKHLHPGCIMNVQP